MSRPHQQAAERQLKVRGEEYVVTIACCLVLLLLVLLARPYAEIGVNDDWSYAWMARELVATGHIHYDGFASAMLGWQLYWGTVFIRLFGFSFTALRFSTLLIAMVVVALLHRLSMRLGVTPKNATVLTLAVALSPVFFPLSFSFMSDIAGLLALFLCIYCCVRALQTSSSRAITGWLIAAAVSNVGLGTVRQVAWLGVLIILPSTTWLLRASRKHFILGATLWLLGAASVLTMSHWYNQQPYAVTEALFAGTWDRHWLAQWSVLMVRSALALCLLLLPLLLSFLPLPAGRQEPKKRRWFLLSIFVCAELLLAAVAFALTKTQHSLRMITPFSNNLVTARGFVDVPDMLGHRPDVVPVWVRILLLGLIVTCVAALLWSGIGKRGNNRQLADAGPLSEDKLITLLGPFTVVYVLLLITRGNLYDRYLLPLMIVLAMALVRKYQSAVGPQLRLITVGGIAVIAAFNVVAMHDLFATSRARLMAANEIEGKGIPRDNIRGGFEYDGWTQLIAVGHINDHRIRIPRDAYHLVLPDPALKSECDYWFTAETPVVHGRYGLSYEPVQCVSNATSTAIPYSTWLAPHDRAIYVQAIR